MPALVLLLALAWQLSPLSTPIRACGPLLFDEGVCLGEALALSGRAPARPPAPLQVEQMPMSRPVHTLLVAGVFRAVGPRPWAGALVAWTCAALALAALFALVAQVSGPRLACLATGALACTNLFDHLAYTGLAETAPMLFLIAGTWALARRRAAWDVGGGALLGACLAANPRFALALPAVGLFALAGPRSWPGLAGGAAAAAAALSGAFAAAAALSGAGLASLFALGKHDSQYLLQASRLDEYPLMLLVCEGPLWCALAGAGIGLALRRPGPLRWLAGAGPLVSFVVLSVGYGHHQLRYVSLLLPGLALACAVALEELWLRIGGRGGAAVALALACALPLTRAALPRGLPVAYARALDALEADGARLVLASNYPVLQLLSDCRTGRLAFLPPVRDAAAVARVAPLGVTHAVLDFERWFLGKFERGEVVGAGDPAGLARIAQVMTLPNPAGEGPYVWFEHGVMRPPPEAGDAGAVRLYRFTRNSP